MFKGQGQTALLSPLCCPLNIFSPLHLINTILGAGVALNEYMIPIDFQVTCSKVKVKPLFSAHCVFRSISLEPFTWSIPNLVKGLPSMCIWSLLIFRSHVQRSRSIYSFEPSVLSTLYILIPWLHALYRFCFYREDKPEFCNMGGIDVSKTFLDFISSTNSRFEKKMLP